VVEIGDAADLLAGALVVDALDVGLAVAVGVEDLDPVARLVAGFVLHRLGVRALGELRRADPGGLVLAAAPEHREADERRARDEAPGLS